MTGNIFVLSVVDRHQSVNSDGLVVAYGQTLDSAKSQAEYLVGYSDYVVITELNDRGRVNRYIVTKDKGCEQQEIR